MLHKAALLLPRLRGSKLTYGFVGYFLTVVLLGCFKLHTASYE